MTKLKLAAYQPWIYLHGGLERTILELVKRSRHDWTIYTGHYEPENTFPGFADLDVRTLRPTNVDRRMVNVLASAAQVFAQRLPLEPDHDGIVVFCDGIGDMLTFRNGSLPTVNLCFTPLRAAFDPWYEQMALRNRTLFQRLIYAGFKAGFRTVDRAAWKRYRGVIAISSEVRQRILAGGLCEPDRVALAHPGIDWPPRAQDLEYDSFILLSGRIMWTKNIELAIQAFRKARLPSSWRLVIAGYVDHKSTPYLAQLRELASDCKQIEFVVSPSDDEMNELLRRASFTLFTPMNEDWGIVPIESMACAKPVIAVDSGGPRETIVHKRTGYLLPPDEDEWAAAIAKLAADPVLVRTMGQEGLRQANRFTWEIFTSDVDDALERWIKPAGSHR